MANRRFFLQTSITAVFSIFLTSFRKATEIFDGSPQYNILLGRPSANSIVLSVLPKDDIIFFIEYGNNKNNLTNKSTELRLEKRKPIEITLKSLAANERYYYRACYQYTVNSSFTKDSIRTFHTQRKKGTDFTFTITADSHLGTAKHCDPALYQITLNNVANDNPDLHFSLGDDFRASKVNEPDYNKIEALYHTQREYLGTLCHSVPYFFILGNHEMEAKAFFDGTDNCLAAWSEKARTAFIPNPIPDHFYSGNKRQDKNEVLRQNYYAFEWGDVLFLTLDVFWYSNISAADEEMREQNKVKNDGLTKEERMKERENREKEKEANRLNKNNKQNHKDQWNFTIGKEQYDWLVNTLENSQAKYKFVLGHHVLGSCRGATEWANTFEWGGKNRRGINEFHNERPGWKMPIHELFVKNKVTAFFQGHDHLFAKQDLDGIAYITCPMCGDPGYNTYNSEAYLTGDKLSNTGHLKLLVSKNEVEMHYIKAVLPKDEIAQGKNAAIAYKLKFKA